MMRIIVDFFEPYQNYIGWIIVIATIIAALGATINQLISFYNPENVNEIIYNENGQFGINILQTQDDSITPGTYSMQAIIPIQQKLKVKISGNNWFFPVGQQVPGWVYSKNFKADNSRIFETMKTGKVDFNLSLEQGNIQIEIFENDSSNPIKTKSIIITE